MNNLTGFGNNGWYSNNLGNIRRFVKSDDKPFGDDFPFKIERKPTDNDEFYKGLCQGAKAVYEMLNIGIFEDSTRPVTFFLNEKNGCVCGEHCLDDYEDYEDEVYEAGFEDGFRKGIQVAQDEMREEIYIDSEKICKLDQLHNEILELGRKLHPSDIDMLNSVLNRIVELKYNVAKDAVDDYLGYK